MAKPGRRRGSLHSAGKVQEADLLARARALRDDPSLACPVCEGGCVLFSPVAAARRGIARAHAARDDEAKLARLASSGNQLVRAYAATLLLARADKIPYVAELKLPGVSAPYVTRGKAQPFFVAGLQNHTDRQLRLLSVMPWVKKRGLHVYSADRGLVCTGKRDAPPADFVDEELSLLGLSSAGSSPAGLTPGAADPRDRIKRATCGHDDADAVRLRWRAPGVTIERCEQCFDDAPTLALLLRHMALPNARASFEVDARLRPLEGIDAPVELDERSRAAYAAGGMTDAQLLDAARASRLDALRRRSGLLLVAGERSYGRDIDPFVAALEPTPAEERALRAALQGRDAPLVLDRPTAARALGELWADHAREMLSAAANGDAAVVEKLHREKATAEEAAELVRKAGKEGSHRAALAALPAYGALPPAAHAADRIARAFRTGGQDAAVREALTHASGGKVKGVALAFLVELKAEKGQDWRFSQTDRDVAASVAPAIAGLLRGEPDRYHAALRDASARAGETVAFEPRSP